MSEDNKQWAAEMCSCARARAHTLSNRYVHRMWCAQPSKSSIQSVICLSIVISIEYFTISLSIALIHFLWYIFVAVVVVPFRWVKGYWSTSGLACATYQWICVRGFAIGWIGKEINQQAKIIAFNPLYCYRYCWLLYFHFTLLLFRSNQMYGFIHSRRCEHPYTLSP